MRPHTIHQELVVSAISISPSSFEAPRHRRSGVAARSTASVRTRYRRQTAALMAGTTVLGLGMAFAAPGVSPVPAPTPPAAVGAAVSGPTVERTAPTSRNDQFVDAGPRGRAPYPGHRR